MGQHKNKPNNSKKKPNGFRKRLNSASNMTVMLIAGVISIELMYFLIQYFPKWISLTDKVQESAGYWNFLIVLISVPVALVVWHFRDENNRQQIENQRKDINLKEFQKLSEWVSGAHLPEIKTVSKTTNKRNLKSDDEIARQLTLPIEYTTEETEEYSKQPNTTDFDTFSKRDGAIALQISAIYNLLPFFRGDYGESFRLPAFDLLKSTWQIMQQDSLKMFKKTGSVSELERRAKSPLGIALTHVLLSSHKENNQIILRDFYKILPSICLAGMDFNLGVDGDVAINLSDLDLRMADFRGAVLNKVDFQKSKLYGAKFQSAKLIKANLQEANLFFAEFQNAKLTEANLQEANLFFANLQNANLARANLKGANLRDINLENADLRECQFEWEQLKYKKTLFFAKITVNDFISKIYPDWKKENDPEWEALKDEEQTKAMQQFCNQTKMLIFDDVGNQIMPPL
ncbi:hypothetical protein CYK00_12065 [Neisseria sicca]|uniref:Pentapeptide repeat-containing protein n=1 Tax=Neisseria sicca TaxID=490 RepID=A0A2I1X977_NEISI|nr:pentapeptide repeat-containing protein [Neisseria sicca]PLA39186.1 hypothetical protein CYK00_12065 [Neisseria sicca]